MAEKNRSFGLSEKEVEALKAEYAETKRLPNPHRAGAYKFTIDALLALGTDEYHPLEKVRAAFRKAAGDEWYDGWANKEMRSGTTGKDADARFLQNLGVLQRSRDYGLRLLQVGQQVMGTKGAVIDLTRDGDGGLLVRLNTDSAEPRKAGRAAKADASDAKPASPPAGQPRKPQGATKGKAKGRKPTPKAKSPRKASGKSRKAK